MKKIDVPGNAGSMESTERSGSPVAWDRINAALVQWRETYREDRDKEGNPQPRQDPSVTTVAERYTRDPWAVLVSTILSLRTKDEVTIEASTRLLARAPGPEEL
ncbi:MAG: hypothetical protein LBL70_08900, partial [Treponema sp.]|nr:hypothetical protein [Treponema sp.]